MRLERVNALNIALMLASLGIAFLVPFELFLFSYAVLGPLHYLTEISWLHDRGYFLPSRSLAWPTVGFTVVLLLTSNTLIPLGEGPIETAAAAWGPEMRLGALAMALVYVVASSSRGRTIGTLAVALGLLVAHVANQHVKQAGPDPLAFTVYEVFLLVFLTTIVHVYVFTGAFILQGALKSRSISGLLSFAVFLACAIACVSVPVTAIHPVSDAVRSAYDHSATLLAIFMARLVDPNGLHLTDPVFASPVGITMARVIAFAYTYHYLNWFSKTSVIKWHDVPRSRLAVVVAIWVGSLFIYGWDYLLGLNLLFFLSMLHVLLEFPLNWRSFLDIGTALRRRIRPA